MSQPAIFHFHFVTASRHTYSIHALHGRLQSAAVYSNSRSARSCWQVPGGTGRSPSPVDNLNPWQAASLRMISKTPWTGQVYGDSWRDKATRKTETGNLSLHPRIVQNQDGNHIRPLAIASWKRQNRTALPDPDGTRWQRPSQTIVGGKIHNVASEAPLHCYMLW